MNGHISGRERLTFAALGALAGGILVARATKLVPRMMAECMERMAASGRWQCDSPQQSEERPKPAA